MINPSQLRIVLRDFLLKAPSRRAEITIHLIVHFGLSSCYGRRLKKTTLTFIFIFLLYMLVYEEMAVGRIITYSIRFSFLIEIKASRFSRLLPPTIFITMSLTSVRFRLCDN